MPLSGIGFGEMLVIAMLVLIVFGPQRLPEITRSVGKAMREFKRGMNEIQRELEVADRQQKWGSSASRSPAAAAAAAAVPPAKSARSATSDDPDSTDRDPDATGESSGAAEATRPEPVIAPPTFGSDLPEEIESQLAPPHSETAVKIPVAPKVDESAGAEPERSASEVEPADGETKEDG
jgi:TatA/E family protein of Tat protein translocase